MISVHIKTGPPEVEAQEHPKRFETGFWLLHGFRLVWLMSATVLCLLVFADAVKQGAMLMYPLETYGLVMQATPPSVPNRGYCKLNISYRVT